MVRHLFTSKGPFLDTRPSQIRRGETRAAQHSVCATLPGILWNRTTVKMRTPLPPLLTWVGRRGLMAIYHG